jgi:hypothetical protein
MKNLVCLFLTAVLLGSCSPATYITGSWKSPAAVPKPYSSIMVAALTNNTIAKATLENDLSKSLGAEIHVLKSIDEFPPNISTSDSSKTTIMNKVKDKNVDAILTVSILSKETETRYVPGRSPYDPMTFGFYNDFWGYYNYWSPRFYDQGYYMQNKVYFIETNLYDTKTEKLMWSAQSKTYDPEDLQVFSKEFATVIVGKMRTDGVIPPSAKKAKGKDVDF